MSRTTFNANVQSIFQATQQENSAILYTINWAGELDTDTISSDTWATEDSITIASESNTTTTSSCRLSASSPGKYRVVNQIVTAAGDTKERIIDIQIRDNSSPFSASDYGLLI